MQTYFKNEYIAAPLLLLQSMEVHSGVVAENIYLQKGVHYIKLK